MEVFLETALYSHPPHIFRREIALILLALKLGFANLAEISNDVRGRSRPPILTLWLKLNKYSGQVDALRFNPRQGIAIDIGYQA
jgi:hypothetical protein